MTLFRKKPVVVNAVRFQGTKASADEVWQWLKNNGVRGMTLGLDNAYLIIPTLEGQMRADPGDWVIRGIKGEFYPCKPDIFEATYEEVE